MRSKAQAKRSRWQEKLYEWSRRQKQRGGRSCPRSESASAWKVWFRNCRGTSRLSRSTCHTGATGSLTPTPRRILRLSLHQIRRLWYRQQQTRPTRRTMRATYMRTTAGRSPLGVAEVVQSAPGFRDLRSRERWRPRFHRCRPNPLVASPRRATPPLCCSRLMASLRPAFSTMQIPAQISDMQILRAVDTCRLHCRLQRESGAAGGEDADRSGHDPLPLIECDPLSLIKLAEPTSELLVPLTLAGAMAKYANAGLRADERLISWCMMGGYAARLLLFLSVVCVSLGQLSFLTCRIAVSMFLLHVFCPSEDGLFQNGAIF